MTGPLDVAPSVPDGVRAGELRTALAHVGPLGDYDQHVAQLLVSANSGPVVATVASWITRAYAAGYAVGGGA